MCKKGCSYVYLYIHIYIYTYTYIYTYISILGLYQGFTSCEGLGLGLGFTWLFMGLSHSFCIWAYSPA